MTQLLAGDTGGTKTILRLAEASPSETGIPKLTTLYEKRFISAEFVDLVPLVRKFLTEAAAELGYIPAPEKACFSIAGPVINNTCNLTNLSWFLDGARLQRDLGIARVELLNDFGAVGHGIAGLELSDLYTLQEGELQRHAPIAVIGVV